MKALQDMILNTYFRKVAGLALFCFSIILGHVYVCILPRENSWVGQGRTPASGCRKQGAGHGFFNRGKHHDETLREADAFLVKLGWLPKS
jgi:hypothetical protein